MFLVQTVEVSVKILLEYFLIIRIVFDFLSLSFLILQKAAMNSSSQILFLLCPYFHIQCDATAIPYVQEYPGVLNKLIHWISGTEVQQPFGHRSGSNF